MVERIAAELTPGVPREFLRFWTPCGPKGPRAQEQNVKMAKATREAYVEKVTELAKANKVKVMTVPWELGAPKPSEWERIRNLSKEDKKKHRAPCIKKGVEFKKKRV